MRLTVRAMGGRGQGARRSHRCVFPAQQRSGQMRRGANRNLEMWTRVGRGVTLLSAAAPTVTAVSGVRSEAFRKQTGDKPEAFREHSRSLPRGEPDATGMSKQSPRARKPTREWCLGIAARHPSVHLRTTRNRNRSSLTEPFSLYHPPMSYDIYFLNRQPGQSWAEAIEQLEADPEDTDERITRELLEAWHRIVPQARDLLGDVELFANGESCELTHDDTGIQFSIFADEVAITVPYWHAGERADDALGKVYALASVVERETGLQAYDPQVELPVSEASSQQGSALMSSIAKGLHGRFGSGHTP